MNLLLDSHAFIWAISAPDKLSPKAAEAIENPSNEVFVSAVSLWEIAIKIRSKRLAPIGSYDKNLADVAESIGFRLIPLTPLEAATHGNLAEDTHFDPFDRMLIWQAISRKMTLVSKDSEFARFKPDGLRVLWA